jgi:UDP-galactopyranose mutase
VTPPHDVAHIPHSVNSTLSQDRATLVCFSHLRWDFVFQRPQHIMSHLAQHYEVIFWEEPLESDDNHISLKKYIDDSGVKVVTPILPRSFDSERRNVELRRLLDQELICYQNALIRWYYTPIMLAFSRHLNAAYTVYDCMDELAAFRFAPPALPWLERELMDVADVVFTGGHSLYEAKRGLHSNVHPYPSSVDKEHFGKARDFTPVSDQRPRIGFYGVIDERFDIDLLKEVAVMRPEYDFEVVGPVVKIDATDLPQAPNIIYIGRQSYEQLPACLGRWNAAMMPFAINESTRFISPTKTPEYLAGGRPVISTPIRDVERHYGNMPCVMIADNAEGFAAACDCAVALYADRESWLSDVDAQLAQMSWERIVWEMNYHLRKGLTTSRSITRLCNARMTRYDFVIVGAGFAGAVMAERLARDAGKKVLVIDRRHHIGGNAFDERDAAGNLVHRYGPHIFHTNSADIFAYLSRFTEWRPYEHRVLAQVEGKLVPIPINRTTINLLYGLNLESDAEADAFFASRAEPVEKIITSRDVVVSTVGEELYELFFRGYTQKQWGLDPSELNKSVTARIPVRTNTDDRYFADRYQAMPAKGYTAMFQKMLGHRNIEVALGLTFQDIASFISFDKLVWTGAIDEYFGQCFGPLPYRSLSFDHQIVNIDAFQPAGTVNYPSEEVPYTRITEFKHLTGENNPMSSVVYEYPSATGDPYYPIPRPENQELYARYERLADASDVIFVGRLATYRYYNMDQIVGQALSTYKRLGLGSYATEAAIIHDQPLRNARNNAPAAAASPSA